MPLYCYICPACGAIKDVQKPMVKRKTIERCDIDASVMQRDLHREHAEYVNAPGTWPLLSDAAGVAVHQIPEAVEHSRRIGIPTDFTPDGRAIFTGRQHRKRYCEAIGLYDRSGGYSDPQRKGALVNE